MCVGDGIYDVPQYLTHYHTLHKGEKYGYFQTSGRTFFADMADFC